MWALLGGSTTARTDDTRSRRRSSTPLPRWQRDQYVLGRAGVHEHPVHLHAVARRELCRRIAGVLGAPADREIASVIAQPADAEPALARRQRIELERLVGARY